MAATEYPTYETLRKSGNAFSPTDDFCRIRWRLKGSIEDSIHVLHDPYQPNAPFPLEAYQSGGTVHPISKLPLTAPPCSSMKLSIRSLDHYSSDWEDAHRGHADPGEPGVRFENEDDKEDYGDLLRCCGQDDPGDGPTITLRADPGAFLTIGHLIATVHPWLLS